MNHALTSLKVITFLRSEMSTRNIEELLELPKLKPILRTLR